MILTDLERVAASRPGRPLYADLSLTVATGDRLGVVGLNGCGKSTLLRVLVGRDEPEAGAVRQGRGVRVAFLDQQPALAAGTVRDAAAGPATPAWEVEAMLDRLGMGAMLDADVTTLSGGQAKRVALAATLLSVDGGEGDLLVLDEPTNHLDLDAISWLEEHLASFRGGLVMVTHDRHVLDRVTTKVLELDRGKGYVHDGGYAGYLEARALREEQAVSAEATRKNLARTELAWLRRGAPARTAKPKARIASATALVEGRAAAPARAGGLDLAAASGAGTARLGDKVVELHGVDFAWSEGDPPLLRGVELSLDPRERLGIVGPNGSGKTTLLDLIAGRERPVAGVVELGTTVRLGYYDQHGTELDPTQRVRDAVAGGQPPTWEHARLCERFWFDGDAQFAPIGLLSGGERRRLQLLILLAQNPNVLLLDEPTNDLDLDTLRVLEDFLEDWKGALVTVSHDRAFLERTVEDLVAIDPDGRVTHVPGGYAAWSAERKNRRSGPTTAGVGSRAPATTASAAPASTKRTAGARSPSTLRRLLASVEREIEVLDRRQTELATELAAAGADHEQLAKIGQAASEVAASIADAEVRWLALAEEADGTS